MPFPIYAPVGKNGSTVRSKLNRAYFKNLQNRTNVAYQKKKKLHAYRTYVLLDGKLQIRTVPKKYGA